MYHANASHEVSSLSQDKNVSECKRCRRQCDDYIDKFMTGLTVPGREHAKSCSVQSIVRPAACKTFVRGPVTALVATHWRRAGSLSWLRFSVCILHDPENHEISGFWNIVGRPLFAWKSRTITGHLLVTENPATLLRFWGNRCELPLLCLLLI